MNKLYLLPFLLFLVGAWFYFSRRQMKLKIFYAEQRQRYIESHSELTGEQKASLSKGEPWPGMPSKILIELFGEPDRKRVLDQSVTRFIWTYPDLFVYISGDEVAEWKKK
ncbi:hypothetical protein [Spirochaeta isovalerica]|uniref:Uncharacterized protein n=1 Tax=Spirochaeta isovalerica TaxID=150 RepID=A0A841R8S1_9SPIO|nr:hypothetical protein [Spirochaeta isovalerica]MBB6479577.1 hypothetical protein [Spirochaeta isovalerica]